MTRRRPTAAVRRVSLAVVAAGVVAVTLVPAASVGSPGARPAAAGVPALADAQPHVKDRYRETKTLVREFDDAQGNTSEVGQPDKMTVSADGLTELRGRERVQISWTGAHPSGGRAANPYGETGLKQEYPVVVLQCRGVDDPDAPEADQISPETCWTSSVTQRTMWQASSNEALWRVDKYADDADRQQVSGMDDVPAGACPDPGDFGSTHVTPFIAADGTVYPSCNAATMAPEAAAGGAFPAAEIAAYTDEHGRGSVDFEVRSDVENASLGCSHDVACSIVVVPIVGLSCGTPSQPMTDSDKECRKYGRFAPGSTNYVPDGVDTAVSPLLWWSASNWRNRFTIPISFGLPPDACDVLDPRPPVLFNGSELMSQAALQWAPAYCLRKDRFKFQLSAMPDEAGFALMDTGGRPAAFVSSEHEQEGTDPIGYAPTAVTGFEIGYVIDRPNNEGEYTNLRLDPRLIAKLLTQSYPGSAFGAGHPGMEDNPWAITADPEFQQLNPGLSHNTTEAAATLLNLSLSSDIIEQLTEYIADDKDAMAFIGGKPDPWGMKVNPSYKDIDLPRDDWPLLDTYVPKSNDTCWQKNPLVYFNLIAAPVTTLRKIADSLIDAWPQSQTVCAYDPNTDRYSVKRVDRQTFGSRFILGVVSLGDAARFGLRAASLETAGGKYVAPDQASMAAAVRQADQKDKYGPFTMPENAIARAHAYPGTEIVYTAARLQNLDADTAKTVAEFIRTATTEGQRPGRGNGELPAGYLPIRRTGVTAPLFRAAQETADAIEAQTPSPTQDDGKNGSPGDSTTPGSTTPGADTPTDPPSDGASPGADPSDGPVDADTAPTAATHAESSGWGSSLLPVLLVVGLLAGASSIVSRLVGSRTGG